MGNYPNVEIELKNNRYWVLGQLDENLEEVHEIAEIKEDVVLGCNNSSVTKFVNRSSGKINMKTEKKSREPKRTKTSSQSAKLTCFHVNARSIVNKRDELELYVLDEKPDIIGITDMGSRKYWGF